MWIDTDYYYHEGDLQQKIMYEPDTLRINRWDSYRGNDILDQYHKHYWGLFFKHVLPDLICKGVYNGRM